MNHADIPSVVIPEGIQILSFGSTKIEWTLAAYLVVARRLNSWKVPYSEIVKARIARKRQQPLPRSFAGLTIAIVRWCSTRAIPSKLIRRADDGGQEHFTAAGGKMYSTDGNSTEIRDTEIGVTCAEERELLEIEEDEAAGVTYVAPSQKLFGALERQLRAA